MATEKQEARSEQVSYRCTPTEKRAVQYVANHRDISEGEVLRTMVLREAVDEYERLEFERLRAKHEGAAA